jgi:hypothetical protein
LPAAVAVVEALAAPVLEPPPPAPADTTPPVPEIDPSDRVVPAGRASVLDTGASPQPAFVLSEHAVVGAALSASPLEKAPSTSAQPAGAHDRKAQPVPALPHPRTTLSAAGIAPPASGGGGGSGGSGGTGAAAALALWLLLQFPGLSVLRLPRSRRSPRSRVDDLSTSPG